MNLKLIFYQIKPSLFLSTFPDNYIRGLIEKEKFSLVEQLLLDGYTEFQPVLDKLSSEGQTEEVKNFLQSIPEVQVKQ